MYDAEVNGEVTTFGTSGFLYQSNKLMYDRATDTLWHSLTGEPVIGRLANSGIELTSLPVDVVTWSNWVAAHPDTTVLSTETGFRRPYLPPSDPDSAYFEYFNSPNRLFPTFTEDERLGDKEVVLGLHFESSAKAYQVTTLAEKVVVNDTVGGQDVVIITGLGSGGASAFERDGLTFSVADGADEIIDSDGTRWRVTGDALVTVDGTRTLDRLPSRELFWLGWSAFFPLTELYGE